jgi:hypothetical protein
MGKISPAGVLRLRATKLCVREYSVMRSAQDDDFVGVLTRDIPNEQPSRPYLFSVMEDQVNREGKLALLLRQVV